ncbi:hypothetical protein V5799_005492 [Amblyomma americanum]|uniref:Uncharacterized protein n=1 Tax=Amblyomma americanum TaxID=6943 RepID=A0AAQ4DZ37_AMBAM
MVEGYVPFSKRPGKEASLAGRIKRDKWQPTNSSCICSDLLKSEGHQGTEVCMCLHCSVMTLLHKVLHQK